MARVEYDNGYYEGGLRDGMLHGQGTYYWNDGDKYVGEWRNGDRTGQGTYYFANGSRYEGEFYNGFLHGQGTFYFANGDKYVGEWRNDDRTGQGTYYWNDGDKYVGEFLNGERAGKGTFYFANGDKYEGCWSDSENATNVTRTYNGKRIQGKIVNSEFIEYETNNRPWQAWNDYDTKITYEGRQYVEIDGYYFGEEAIARTQPSCNHYHGKGVHYSGYEGRSISPDNIIYAINYSLNNCLTKRQENGRNRHYCGSISVITTSDNKYVITVYDNPDGDY